MPCCTGPGTLRSTAMRVKNTQMQSPSIVMRLLRRFGGNLKLLRRMLGNFEPEMQKQLQQLNSHATQGDLKAVLAQLHMLKGSAGTMGRATTGRTSGEP